MIRYITIILICLLSTTHPAAAQITVDAEGWSEISPGADSRVIYVSSSEGDDANDGLSAETPVATLTKAATLARPGMPDHILLKTGDVFTTEFGVGNFHSGKSPGEPTVISYYGDGDVRPIVDCERGFMSVFQVARSNIAIVGIDFYASNQDPNSDNFDPEIFHGSRNAFSMIGFSGGNILIEDCKFRYIGLGAFTALEPGNIENIHIRRNIVVDAWADSTYFFHYSDGRNRQQGMYIEDTDGVLIEENLFDHNGWNAQVPGAGKNKFNHNVYMQVNNPNSDNIRVRGNILARASAHGIQMRSGGRATDNLLVRNSVNLNVGYIPRPPADRSATGYIADNIFLEVIRMDSTEEDVNNSQRSGALWGVNTINLPSVVEDNIFAHALNTETNVIAVGNYDDRHNLGGSLQQSGNLVYRWFDKQAEPEPEWFDPNRQLKDYSRKLGLEATTEAFLERARERPLNTWWEEYSADAVNNFIEAGFATDLEDNVPPPAPENAFVVAVTGATALIKWTWAFDDVRTKGYNVYLNGEKVNANPVPADSLLITGLSSATQYSAEIKTVDAGDNESEGAAAVTFTTDEADTEAPTVPAGLTVQDKAETTIDISWNPSTDNRTVEGYYVYLDGSRLNEEPIADTTFTIADLISARSYRINVTAVDFAGNESEETANLFVKTVDSERPTDPTDVEAVILSNGSIRANWSPSTDNDTLAGYNVYVNFRTGDEPAAFTEDTTVTFETGAEPPYMIRVQAVDISGNRSRPTRPVEAEPSTSVADVDANEYGIQVFPNPADNLLRVSIKKGNARRISLRDVAGRIVREQSLNSATTAEVNVSDLASGAYSLSIYMADGARAVRKVWITH